MKTRTLHSPEYQALTKWLRKERNDQDMTVRGLAERIGTFHSLIVKVEQCERDLSVVEYVQYCNALGIDPQAGIDIVQKRMKKRRR